MKYCCSRLNHEIEDSQQNGDGCINYLPERRMFGIVINRDKKIYQPIEYCPFCGSKFPKDLVEEYWDYLVQDAGQKYYPTDENYDPKRPIPPEFRTDEWWKKRGL